MFSKSLVSFENSGPSLLLWQSVLRKADDSISSQLGYAFILIHRSPTIQACEEMAAGAKTSSYPQRHNDCIPGRTARPVISKPQPLA